MYSNKGGDETCSGENKQNALKDWLPNGCAVTHVSTIIKDQSFYMTQNGQGSITESSYPNWTVSLWPPVKTSSWNGCSLLNTALCNAHAVSKYSNLSFQSGVCFTPMLKHLSYLCHYVTTAPPSEPVKQNIQSLKHYSSLDSVKHLATSAPRHCTYLWVFMITC